MPTVNDEAHRRVVRSQFRFDYASGFRTDRYPPQRDISVRQGVARPHVLRQDHCAVRADNSNLILSTRGIGQNRTDLNSDASRLQCWCAAAQAESESTRQAESA